MTRRSFSQEVKSELCEVKVKEKEAVSELAAMILFGENAEEGKMCFKTDKANIAARIQFIIKKATQAEVTIDVVKGKRNYSVEINRAIALEAGVNFTDDGDIEFDEDVCEDDITKRAFLRGAFIISGTIIDPLKGYSCELITYNENMAYLASEILESFDIKANTVKRNNSYVTYLKDKESISDFLSIVGAHRLMMEFMVTQIEKDRNNRNNRASNCQAANLDKAITASVNQCNAILKLQSTPLWDSIDEDTKKLAQLRLEFFDQSIAAIGKKMSPEMTKSSVNRRLSKLIEMANNH